MTEIRNNKPIEQVVRDIFAMNLDPIKFKLMDTKEGLGWSREYADHMEIEYKRFLALSVKYPDAAISPSKEVDNVWHAHILDTMKYAEDCQNVFGYFVHHFPYLGMRGEDDAAQLLIVSSQTKALYELEFGAGAAEAGSYCSLAKPAAQAGSYCSLAKPVAKVGRHLNEAVINVASRPTLLPA